MQGCCVHHLESFPRSVTHIGGVGGGEGGEEMFACGAAFCSSPSASQRWDSASPPSALCSAGACRAQDLSLRRERGGWCGAGIRTVLLGKSGDVEL